MSPNFGQTCHAYKMEKVKQNVTAMHVPFTSASLNPDVFVNTEIKIFITSEFFYD